MPPSQFVCIEGLPGIGKTFVISTIWNMTHIFHNTNRADLASAPTGYAAALINGSTHCQAAAIPTGEHFYNAPINLDTKIAEKNRVRRTIYSRIITRRMDKQSMTGCPDWAWL